MRNALESEPMPRAVARLGNSRNGSFKRNPEGRKVVSKLGLCNSKQPRQSRQLLFGTPTQRTDPQYPFRTRSPRKLLHISLLAEQFIATPVGLADSDFYRTRRNILVLQQCTGCHSDETGTAFQHISENGALSYFLLKGRNASPGDVGVGSTILNWNPTLNQLTAAPDKPNSATFPVTIHYCIPSKVLPSNPVLCDDDQKNVTENRLYHDLARRKLFMASLLAAPRTGPTLRDISNLKAYGPSFAH
jgi:hypothetical protein